MNLNAQFASLCQTASVKQDVPDAVTFADLIAAHSVGKFKVRIGDTFTTIYPIVDGHQGAGELVDCPQLQALGKRLEFWVNDGAVGSIKASADAAKNNSQTPA